MTIYYQIISYTDDKEKIFFTEEGSFTLRDNPKLYDSLEGAQNDLDLAVRNVDIDFEANYVEIEEINI
jgi:hypothetical protein